MAPGNTVEAFARGDTAHETACRGGRLRSTALRGTAVALAIAVAASQAPLAPTAHAASAPAAKAAPALNVTGTWTPPYWTIPLRLQQQGETVVGSGGSGDFWLRGRWDGPRLVLVVNRVDTTRKTCEPRGTFVLSGTTVTTLNSVWERPGRPPTKGAWVRKSPDAGAPVDYSYAQELQYCGSLRTYELAFASGADTLQDEDAPILGAVADFLKSEPGARIQVHGHTDSTGDADKNRALSERRAATVKRVLVDRYSVDEGQIDAAGFGADQPVAENGTQEGRAMNRRVEIVLGR